MTLAVNLAAMVVAYYAVLWYQDFIAPEAVRAAWKPQALDPGLLVAVVLIFGELMLVTAVALFFSTFSSPLLSMVLTLALWLAGHFNADLRQFESRRLCARRFPGESDLLSPAKSCAVQCPDRSRPRRAGLVRTCPADVVACAAVYTTALLVAAMAIFRKKDFK